MFNNDSFGTFKKTLSAHPIGPRKGASEHGDKVILPDNLLQELLAREIQYPMLFKLQVESTKKSVYCGVSEFTAPDGTIFIPQWMMTQLQLKPGQDVQLFNVILQKGQYLLIRPHTYKFVETCSDPKTILEGHLSRYATLTKGTTIQIQHQGEVWYFDIQDLKPARAVCIIDCDLRLEFDEPIDIKEYEQKQKDAMENRKIQQQFQQTASEFQENKLLAPTTPQIHTKSPAYQPDTPTPFNLNQNPNSTPKVGADNGVNIFAQISDDEDSVTPLSERFGSGNSIKKNAVLHPAPTTLKPLVQPIGRGAMNTVTRGGNSSGTMGVNNSAVFNQSTSTTTTTTTTNADVEKKKRDELVRQQRAALFANRGKQTTTTTTTTTTTPQLSKQEEALLGTNQEFKAVVQLNDTNDDHTKLTTIQDGDWLIYLDDKGRPIKREAIVKSFAMTGIGNSIKKD